MELFNVPNSANVLTVNETVGPLYFNPQAITTGTPRAVRRADRLVDGRHVVRGRPHVPAARRTALGPLPT